MSAVPQRSPASAVPESVLFFRDKYAQALVNAQISAELTATPGWQQLYSGHRAATRQERHKIATDLKAIALEIEDHGPSEEREKLLTGVKKQCEALRDSDLAFEMQAVGPVREPVSECDRIRLESMNDARRTASESPLTHATLEELMREEVGRVDRPTWDGESGLVKIVTPVD